MLFLIYINDLSEGLITNVRLFADDFSLFSVVDNINLSTTNLNSDLSKINVQKVIFSCKIKKTSHPSLNFNNNTVKQVQFQKHLAVYLDDK